MAQKTMYSAVNNSIQATLTASIAATDTIIPLSSVSYLPSAPNLVTIGTDDDAEVIRYNGIDGLTLTGCERGFDGTTAKVWLVNEVVYRAFTHYDHETFKSNIEDLDTDKLAKTGDGSSTTVSFTTATQRTALATGSKLSVLFGLLSKCLTDLKGLAFKDKVTSSDFENNAVSNSALAQMAAKTIKGNATAAAASPTDLSASNVRTLLNVADGADVTATEIAGATAATSMTDSDTIPIVSGEEIKRVTPSVLKTKLNDEWGTVITVASMDLTPAQESAAQKNIGILHDYELSSREIPYTWAELHTKIAAGDFSGLREGDYKDITLSGTFYDAAAKANKTLNNAVFRMEIAGIDNYFRYADTSVPHHVDFISRDCMAGNILYNATDTNSGGFTGSALFTTLNGDSGLQSLLSSDVAAVIIEKRALCETKTSANASGWAWGSHGKLWLPSEFEVWGGRIWAEQFTCGPAVQYPIFKNSLRHIVKGDGNGGGRCHWWCSPSQAGSASNFCNVGSGGNPHGATATDTWIRVPLCFRVA